MSWAIHHNESAKNAAAAEMAARQGNVEKALELYNIAAEDEMRALAELDESKIRTVGITAVSAASLWYKAHHYYESQKIANQYLSINELPHFAKQQLNSIIQLIKTENTELIQSKDRISKIEKNLADYIAFDTPKEKLELEKLFIEKEKIKLERDKLLVTSLIEDFKARWQELLNFENENSRWQTLYVTSLILVVSWILSNSGKAGKFTNIAEIFEGENSVLLLCLAFINAIYTLAMAYKGYQIQEIAQYLYMRIGDIVSDKTDYRFNSWERWRRNEEGKPTLIRTIFYAVISILPTLASGVILFLYYKLEYFKPNEHRNWINFVFIVVLIFVLVSFFTALYTTRMNKVWEKIFAEEDKKNKDGANRDL